MFISINIGNEVNIKFNLQFVLEHLRFSKSWNPRAHFVIILLDYLFLEPNKITYDILLYLFKNKILKAIVIKYNMYASDKLEGNTIKLYSWIPNHNSKYCDGFENITVINTWINNGDKGYFIKNNSLFEENIKMKTRGCPFRISTFPVKYFIIEDVNFSLTKPVFKEGLEIQMIKIIAKKLEMDEYYLPVIKDPWFLMDKDGNVSGYARELYYNNADIAFGALSLMEIVPILTDSTNIHFWDKISWYVPCGTRFPRWESITRIFSITVWLCIVLSVILAVVTIIFLARKSVCSEQKSYKSGITTLYYCFGVLIAESIALPNSSSVRLFFLSWLCYSLSINTVFQAYLTTFLIDPGFRPHFKTFKELLDSDMKLGTIEFDLYLYNYSSSEYISRILEKNEDCSFKNHCVEWAIKYKNLSVIQSELNIAYLIAASLIGSSADDTNLLCGIDEVVQHLKLVTLMPKGSPLYQSVNDIIVRITEAGLYKQWLNLFLYEQKIKNKKYLPFRGSDEYTVLTLAHMQSPFLVMTLGYGLSIIMFTGEMIHFRIKMLDSSL
ncbi:hypothetical protein L9F63_010033 [Diploptera punctata]|uniref:Ionotropic glutamate receptor C-terminal domain-containing protein n=1 Tax=Diploptera punctata TaxID=6984 RepID=A0AAD8ERB4_DIPPU|nr:hypothetical protein L9F63_010033 [Diploptera punctata]